MLHKVLFSAAPSWGIYFAKILLSPTLDTSYGVWYLSPSYSSPQNEKRSCGSLSCIMIQCLLLLAWKRQRVSQGPGEREGSLVPNIRALTNFSRPLVAPHLVLFGRNKL